jgi:hypothetical protein
MKRPLFEIVKSPNLPDTESISQPKRIYQLKISLRFSTPTIWRRVLVSSDMLLPELHEVIQTVMGWNDEHLHQFIQNEIKYAPSSGEDSTWRWQANHIDYGHVRISDLLQDPKDKLDYEYDFGDGWFHHIVLEKIYPWNASQRLPVCTDGELSCPPEDCGGMMGYYGLLEVLKNPSHEEYEDLREWVGEDFDPTYFDVEEVNAWLCGGTWKG